MALIVEDGTGLADADSYASLADAAAYHESVGNAAWAALDSDTVREQLLRVATYYMVETYRTMWAGTRMTSTQALDWPRYEVPMVDAPGGDYWAAYYPSNEVPAAVKRACAVLALKASTTELSPDLGPAAIREKVGPIEVEYSAGYQQQTRYQAIDNMLAPLLRSTRGVIPVVRI